MAGPTRPVGVLAHALHDAAASPIEAAAVALAVLVLMAVAALPRHRHLAGLDEGTAGTGTASAAASPRSAPLLHRLGRRVLAAVGLAGFAVVLATGWLGPDDGSPSLAPLLVLVLAWAGLLAGSALLGDVWPLVSPFTTLATAAGRVTPRRWFPVGPPPAASDWAAPVLLSSFVWLQQAYHTPGSPRAVALFVTAYTVVVLTGAAVWGPAWLRSGEGYAALGRLVAGAAPLGRGPAGRWGWRRPGSGLGSLRASPVSLAVLVVAIGGLAFEALTYTGAWVALAGTSSGWTRTAISSVGLAWATATVAVVHLAGARRAEGLTGGAVRGLATRLAPALVPLLLGLAVAVEGAVTVFSGRFAVVLASDPLRRGWDLFGTGDGAVSVGVLSAPGTVAAQTAALAVGGVLAVTTVRRRALAVCRTRAAAPVSAAMLPALAGLTVTALLAVLLA